MPVTPVPPAESFILPAFAPVPGATASCCADSVVHRLAMHRSSPVEEQGGRPVGWSVGYTNAEANNTLIAVVQAYAVCAP